MVIDFLAGEGGIALLDVNPGLVIWTTITFLLVVFVLQRLAWKPIAQALDARADKIHTDLDRAESIRKEAEEKLSEYMGRLDSLKDESQKIVSTAKADAERLKEEILASANQEAEAIKERGIRDIKLATDKALEELHGNIANLSVAVASQILGKALNADDHKKLIEESIGKIKSLN